MKKGNINRKKKKRNETKAIVKKKKQIKKGEKKWRNFGNEEKISLVLYKTKKKWYKFEKKNEVGKKFKVEKKHRQWTRQKWITTEI